MSTVHISESWADLIEPGLKAISTNEELRFTQADSMKAILFDMESCDTSYAKYSSASALGDFEEFNGTVGYQTTYQGYDTKIEFPEKVLGIQIERKLADDDMYGIMASRAEELGYSAGRTQEKDAAAIFNEAFTTSSNSYVTHSEGQAVCSSAHPYPNGSSSTQSNAGTTALSATGVETTRQLMAKFRGDNQEIINCSMDTILVPIEGEEPGFEIINSTGKVDQMTNNANFHQGKYKLIVWKNYLTDTNNWFGIDMRLAKKYLKFISRIPFEVTRDTDTDTLIAKYVGYIRYWRWWINWRFIYGHLVS